jgi:hypothetical protein
VIMHGGLNGPSFIAICFGLIWFSFQRRKNGLLKDSEVCQLKPQ